MMGFCFADEFWNGWGLVRGGGVGVLCPRPFRVLPPENYRRIGSGFGDTERYFPFKPPVSPEAWDRGPNVCGANPRSEWLWPMPTKTAANPVVYGRVDRDDYTEEKFYLESFPDIS